ncbi:MAG: Nif11-like leader peptide family natural product precursor [Oscillospiraceae bacterium]|nr:Nif11-like leader peptide family natural product precursor [Oscillospiraceae bacterium]
MANENLQKFLNFLAEDKERQAKANSFDGDADAISAYAQECGFEVSAQELGQLRENSRKFIEARMKKAEAQKAQLTPGVQALYALMELAETDSEVAKELEALGPDVTRAQLIAYGKEKGFVFGEQDLDDVGKDALDQSEELSDEELELVAGGTTAVAGFVIAGILIAGAVTGAFVISVWALVSYAPNF